MMQKILNSKPFYIVISLLFAILLFFNANSINIRNSKGVTASEMYNITVHDVPIQLNYDQSKYYITGFDASATVFLSSYNRVRLDAEKSEATRSFSLVADLTHAKEGTIEVPLHVEGLNTAVTAEVEPKSISVTIEPRITQKMDVQAMIDETQLDTGYSVSNIDVEPKEVEVTTGAETIKLIDHIEARLPKDVILDHDYTGTIQLKAVNKQGEQLPVETKPETVQLSVHVQAPQKDVQIVAVQSGTLPKDVLQYKFSLSQDYVTISGPPSELERVEVIQLPVDISGITKKQDVEVRLNEDLYSATPNVIKVTVEPIKKAETKETSSDKKQSKESSSTNQSEKTASTGSSSSSN
jgi:YbbR domain-containing protein